MHTTIPYVNPFFPQHPQQLLEHLLLYANEAHQFIDPELTNIRITLSPRGYHFYAGIVQAATFAAIFSNPTTKHLLLIAEDTHTNHAITLTDCHDRNSWLGAILPIDTDLTTWIRETNDDTIIENKRITENLSFGTQLPFAQLFGVESVTPIIINPLLTPDHSQSLLQSILTQNPDISIVFCHNLSEELSYEISRNRDQKLVEQMVEETITPDGVLGIIHQLVVDNTEGRDPQVYVNTGDIGDNDEKTSGYVSLVG